MLIELLDSIAHSEILLAAHFSDNDILSQKGVAELMNNDLRADNLFFEDLPEYQYLETILDVFKLNFRSVIPERHQAAQERRSIRAKLASK